jgi:lipid-A-disaccharide synthase
VRAHLDRHPLPAIEVCTRRTTEILHLAYACVAVSGSVGLELLYRGNPSVVLYRIRSLLLFLVHRFKKSPFISLVNLLAEKELFPEYLTSVCEARPIAGHILRWLNDEAAHRGVCRELEDLRARFAEPGACERAANFILDQLENARALSHSPDRDKHSVGL